MFELNPQPFIPDVQNPDILLKTSDGREVKKVGEEGHIEFEGITYRPLNDTDKVTEGSIYLFYRNQRRAERNSDGEEVTLKCIQELAHVRATVDEYDIDWYGTNYRSMEVTPVSEDGIYSAYYHELVYRLKGQLQEGTLDIDTLTENDFITTNRSTTLQVGNTIVADPSVLYIALGTLDN